jgi:hypothetical protein
VFTWPDSGEAFSVAVPLPEELGRVLDAVAAEHPRRGGG